MQMENVPMVIVGAGVIGLAIARAVALKGYSPLILERESDFGQITSARNSEVIHAGIYYPKDSLKAKFCVQGKEALYTYAQKNGIAHKRLGKFIVASDAEGVTKLEAIAEKARQNAVMDLEFWGGAKIRAIEPDLKVEAGLFSPSTGIIDSHGLMQTLLGEAEAHDAMLVCQSELEAIDRKGEYYLLHIRSQGEILSLQTPILINAAGLGANQVAHMIEGLKPMSQPDLYLCKGNYFTLSGKAPFSHLIYPVPSDGGLGVHLTLDLQGAARFGPDTEWVKDIDYSVDEGRKTHFIEAISHYWPAVQDDQLLPGYSGIRPKLKARGEGDADFRIEGPETHGLPGLVNLFGIESPGLTSSLAIADYVVELLEGAAL